MKSKYITYICIVLVLAGIVFCAVSIARNRQKSSIDTIGTESTAESSSGDIAAPVTFAGTEEQLTEESSTDSAESSIATAANVTLPTAATTVAATSSYTTLPQQTSRPSSSAAATSAPSTTAAKPAQTTKATSAANNQAGVVTDYEYAYAGFTPKYADLDVPDWTLILVNRDYILPEGYTPQLALSVPSDSDSKKLDYRVAPHYNEMYQAAKKDGIILDTVSGYRSYSLQRTNFENKIKKYENQNMSRVEATQKAATIILPPGTSEHNLGFAMDICSLEQSFDKTAEYRWLVAHAADYGFILRYPKDKQDVTKIIYEPWHWRYVGVENAKKINASGLCLEEYLGKA